MLKYQWLNDFDEDMVKLTQEHKTFSQRMGDLRLLKEAEKIIVFSRNGLLFAFNFHPSESQTNVPVPVYDNAEYTVALSSDDEKYGGQELVAHMTYPTKLIEDQEIVELYLPARTAVVLKEKKLPKRPKFVGKAAKSSKKVPSEK